MTEKLQFFRSPNLIYGCSLIEEGAQLTLIPLELMILINPNDKVYHCLNLVWGVKPVLLNEEVESFEDLTAQAQNYLLKLNFATPGEKILIVGSIPTKHTRGKNFLKIHTIS